jgi:hypothetical protein
MSVWAATNSDCTENRRASRSPRVETSEASDAAKAQHTSHLGRFRR